MHVEAAMTLKRILSFLLIVVLLVALYFFVYNFIARHGTLRMPPALKAGVTDHVWSYEELVELIDRAEAEPVVEPERAGAQR